MGVDALVEEGRAALAGCDWATAQARFADALAQEETAAALDGLGQALYWQGHYARALALRERAYVRHRSAGAHRAAALVAVRLAALHWLVYGNAAAANGWLAHAERMAARAGDCPEHGWVLLAGALGAADPEEREHRLQAACEIGRRFGDAGLEFDALAYLGQLLAAGADLPAGLRLLDEAVAAIAGGVVTDPWAAGEILCTFFGTCELVVDVPRAEGWLRAVDGYVERTGELPIAAICRMHYGGVLTAAGRWPEAEHELAAALEIYDDTYRGTRFEPLLRLAGLRARQGRFGEVRRLVEGFEDTPEAAWPCARLHLADGEPRLAARTLERCLTRRGRGIGSVPLLALLVEAQIAAGDLVAAAAVADELTGLAEAGCHLSTLASAALARGRVGQAAGRPEAVADLEAAVIGFSEAEQPHDGACARLALATALAEASPEQAVAEARAALGVFLRLGAGADADAAAALLRHLGDRARPWPRGFGTLTKRESEVLELLAEGCSNGDIAARLSISPRTAEHHVTNILSKLGLANRAEAAAHAVRARLER